MNAEQRNEVYNKNISRTSDLDCVSYASLYGIELLLWTGYQFDDVRGEFEIFDQTVKCYIATRYDGFDTKLVQYEFLSYGNLEFAETSGIVSVRPWYTDKLYRSVDSKFSHIKALKVGQETIQCKYKIQNGQILSQGELNISVEVIGNGRQNPE